QRNFLEHDRDLAAVWRCPGVEVDHRCWLLIGGGTIAALLCNGIDLLAQAIVGSHKSVKVAGRKSQQATKTEGDNVGGSRPIVDERELSKEIAGAKAHRLRG